MSPRVPVGSFFLLFLAALLYVIALSAFIDIKASDPAGRGLAAAYGLLFGIGLWLVLGGMLLLTFLRGDLPRQAAAVVLVLFALGAAASFEAAGLHAANAGKHGVWPLLVIAVLPPLFAGYALGLRLASPAQMLKRRRAGIALGLVVAAISLPTIVAAYVEAHPGAARQAAQMEELRRWQAARDEEDRLAREREAVAFARLNPDSSLRDYLDHLAPGDSRFREAVAGARLVKSRHADAIALLREGKLIALQEFWRIDLAPTAELCAAYNDALFGEALKVAPGRGAYLSLALDLERQLPNIQWLTGEKCNLDPALAALETNLRKVSDSERLDKFAATIASFRQPR